MKKPAIIIALPALVPVTASCSKKPLPPVNGKLYLNLNDKAQNM